MCPLPACAGLAGGSPGFCATAARGTAPRPARPAPVRRPRPLTPASRGEHDGVPGSRGSGASPDTATVGGRSGTATGEPPRPPDTATTQGGSFGPGHSTKRQPAAPRRRPPRWTSPARRHPAPARPPQPAEFHRGLRRYCLPWRDTVAPPGWASRPFQENPVPRADRLRRLPWLTLRCRTGGRRRTSNTPPAGEPQAQWCGLRKHP